MSNNRAAAVRTTPASPQSANDALSLLKEVPKDAVSSRQSHKHLKDLWPLPPHRNLRKVLFKKHFDEAIKGGKSTALFKLTEDDLRKHFVEWDVDKSGAIDLKELKDAFGKLDLGHSDSELKELFDKTDENKDDKISFEEFRKAVYTPCAVEKWAAGIPFAKLLTLFIPCAPPEANNNPLAGLVALARDKDMPAALDKVMAELLPFLKKMILEMLLELKASVEACKAQILESQRTVFLLCVCVCIQRATATEQYSLLNGCMYVCLFVCVYVCVCVCVSRGQLPRSSTACSICMQLW